MKNIRKYSVEILIDVLEKEKLLKVVLEDLSNYDIDEIDKKFINKEVVGTVENLDLIDYVIGLYLKTKISNLDFVVKAILRVGVYELLFMDKVPSYVPGDTITSINGKSNLGIEFFVHSPFKASLIDGKADADKNSTSIVMQARSFEGGGDPVALYVFGGDADHYVWAEVLNQSKTHNNDDKLKYDLFLAPHHCSWTFFNDVPYENPESNKTPLESAKKIIRRCPVPYAWCPGSRSGQRLSRCRCGRSRS